MKPRDKKIILILLIIGGIAFFMSRSAPPLEIPEEIPPEQPGKPTVNLFPPIFGVRETRTLFSFIEVTDSCGAHYEGECLNVRSAPSATSSSVMLLRTGVVLPVLDDPIADATGRSWYKVDFREWIRYPERVHGEWYVASDFVEYFKKPEEENPTPNTELFSNKRIIIDRSDQKLYAYDGDELFMEQAVSTGLDMTPTPRGSFSVLRKTPSRYMQGPLPGISSDYYDLPGVPWNLYFTEEGGAIHGAYWHNSFGAQWSHGCVNLPLDMARQLYDWTPVGTPVLVRD